MKISIEELLKFNAKDYLLYDLRSDLERDYGTIPHSIPISKEGFFNIEKNDKQIIFYTSLDSESFLICEKLKEKGIEASYVLGGYDSYALYKAKQKEDDDYLVNLEKGLHKRFKRDLWSKFMKAISEYELIQENDKIAVCISGGKDSMLLAKLFAELHKHSKVPFELEYIVMDPGYNSLNREIIEANLKKLNIPASIFDTRIFDSVFNIEKSPCYICARMRRGNLYNYAKNLGCNKIALGHHFDDVIETILMSMLYGAQIETMMPKLHSDNFEGMELIRPLYLIREESIKEWRNYNDLHFIKCACKFTENSISKEKELSSKRLETKKLIQELKKNNPQVEMNIFKSVENVQLGSVIGYKKKGIKHSFLDEYFYK